MVTRRRRTAPVAHMRGGRLCRPGSSTCEPELHETPRQYVGRVTDARCPLCGGPVHEHDRHMRFRLPDPVLALPDRDRTDGTWMSGSDANESVMMQVPGAGAFLRALLPTRLTGGYSVTFGVWV